jgi:hypothetical protein
MTTNVVDTADRRIAPKSGMAPVVIVEMQEVIEGVPTLGL